MNPNPVEGGLYVTRDEDNTYTVLKVLKVDPGGVHVRQYSNRVIEIPTSLDSSTLFMAGIHREPNVKLGLGHTPVSHESFSTWPIHFVQCESVSEEELEGYNYWKEEDGGYF